MKVGVTYTLRNAAPAKWAKPWPQFYGEALDHIAEIDRLGFNSINFTEHHFDPDGYNPSIVVMMTAVALRTSRALIGQNILQLPYHHPVRIAEDFATIDILSGGRVTLHAGQGGGPFDDEFRAFGINPKFRPSLKEEGLDIIRKCWTEEVFSYHGKRWHLEDVRVYPKPLQKPHPPIYTTANSDTSMDRAARMGLNASGEIRSGRFALGDKEIWEDWTRRWHAALAKYGRRPEDFQTNTFGTMFVTDDPEREWAKHREAILYTTTYRRFDGNQPYIRRYGTPPETPEDLPGWQTFFRTPDDAVKHLRDCFGNAAPSEILVSADRPGIPFSDTVEYMRLFAEKVMPKLLDLPVGTLEPASSSAH
jgi:alkanesulfonate monooxygenase SsuD/methylene tetrahydromethanopterin reductase-like flavin-dependent oxidoreductase (luciferase family)